MHGSGAGLQFHLDQTRHTAVRTTLGIYQHTARLLWIIHGKNLNPRTGGRVIGEGEQSTALGLAEVLTARHDFLTRVAAFLEAHAVDDAALPHDVAARAEVVLAETQLRSTQAQLIDVGVQRAQFEHAIAILIGKAPADFALAPAALTISIPALPPGLP